MPSPDPAGVKPMQGDWQVALSGRRVLVTGHTGFKGGWLSLWLSRLGAKVVGVSLPAGAGPSFYQSVGVGRFVGDRVADIRSPSAFNACVADVEPDLLIHMAAQALVRPSYDNPVDTYLTNVVGTSVVLDAARRMPSLRGIIVVTSDKCYDNREWVWGYRETDPMGGADPYSSSKGCAELVAAAYRRSFFSAPEGPALATARAGNVIGGGDWSVDRIVPDLVRAKLAGLPADIRNPWSVRPWQHVLEPLGGYLMLAARLLDDGQAFAGAWNFGPDPDATVDVDTLVGRFRSHWGEGAPQARRATVPRGPHEATLLRLDNTKARTMLGWRPRLSLNEAAALTVEWYRAYAEGNEDMRALSEAQVDRYMLLADEPTFQPTQAKADRRLQTCE